MCKQSRRYWKFKSCEKSCWAGRYEEGQRERLRCHHEVLCIPGRITCKAWSWSWWVLRSTESRGASHIWRILQGPVFQIYKFDWTQWSCDPLQARQVDRSEAKQQWNILAWLWRLVPRRDYRHHKVSALRWRGPHIIPKGLLHKGFDGDNRAWTNCVASWQRYLWKWHGYSGPQSSLVRWSWLQARYWPWSWSFS